MSQAGNIVGIDLGTSFSAIARLDESGKPEIIANSEGEQTTPSVLLFEDNCIIVGREARRALSAEPDRVVRYVKREMGNPRFGWSWGKRWLNATTLSALVLKKLKTEAEERIGPIQKAVITVPAYFDDGRRKVTEDAGHIAGLEVIDIFNEPSAAALAYGFGRSDLEETALVYDLGGGTFDVSLVRIEGDEIRVLATDGDMLLGGADWDDRLANHVAAEFRRESGEDPMMDSGSRQDLFDRVEEAKRTLSKRDKAKVICHHAGKGISVDVTRREFEAMTEELLEKTEVTTQLVLEAAARAWKEVDRVLLVGGATRMPMVREMLHRISGKEPDASLAADLVVAQGAAIWAGIKTGAEVLAGDAAGSRRVRNVNSHSLGVAARNPKTDELANMILIEKNSPLPWESSRVLYTKQAGQTKFKIDVLEGESTDPSACISVGTCRVTGLPPNLARKSPIEITYEYDGSGRIRVTAREMKGGGEAKAEIVRTSGMTPDEVETEMRYLEGIEME
ncbi:MAG: Hsp70 family protein [Planctomycetota bacterium]|jgi:molecular chaperone DnaK